METGISGVRENTLRDTHMGSKGLKYPIFLNSAGEFETEFKLRGLSVRVW